MVFRSRPRGATQKAPPRICSASDELVERFNRFDGCEEPLGPERIEVVPDRFRWALQSQAHRPYGLQEIRLRQMKLVRQEFVGMLRFNSPVIELVGGEVLEID